MRTHKPKLVEDSNNENTGFKSAFGGQKGKTDYFYISDQFTRIYRK